MKKHSFVMIRYSVLSMSRSWKLNKSNEFNSYKEKLFDRARLEEREKVFKLITLPSIKNMNSTEVTVLIFVSESMPDEYFDRLSNLVSPHRNFKLVKLCYEESINLQMNATIETMLKEMGEDVVYSTIRLDDDDAVSKNYLELLSGYLNHGFVGYCISFSSGYGAIVNDEKITEIYKICVPKIAIGIAWINFFDAAGSTFEHTEVSVYSLGNHMKVDEKVPTVIDPREFAWIRTIHKDSDIFDSTLVEKYRKLSSVNLEEVKKDFIL
nr:glycosyltransferase [uncultured Halomonas sp.]